ncbi:MAG: argininosuccinate synthase [Candidatus Omnitrophota bacterium]|nr:MAG: argininosuccinate synthase [Candidatus Omnitrophota bacterium]
MKKVVLAYSGGLDTSCVVAYLKDKGFNVICFSANLGSEFSAPDLKKRALSAGASKIYVEDLRQEFADSYVLPALRANAVYQDKYVLSTALGRPLIAKYLVDVARQEKAEYVAHGCSGKGNDQVRIDMTVKLLNSQLKIIAPLREWKLTSRESEIKYAKSKKIPIKATKDKIYSIDKNIWGLSIEAGILEDLGNEPKDNAYIFTQSPKDAPDNSQNVEIEFAKGIPVKINGKKKTFLAVIEELNKLGGKHAIGRTDLIEDRIVGIKSREVYEAPAAWILIKAHKELESLVLDKDTLSVKRSIEPKYAELIYQGLWFSPLKKSLDAFIESTQSKVTGKITLKLYKGNIIVARRYSKNSLYKKELATYGKADKFRREDAQGFINIFSMPYKK